MRVEQAVYGEIQGRGHGLRASSPQASIAITIASKLDLPDAVPHGVLGWSPFVRGFPTEDHYVIARTFLDSSASRGGMVLTHALFVNLDDMCGVGSLAMLFSQLAPAITHVPTSPATLELDIAGGIRATATDLIGTANALTDQGLYPVVRLGIEGFELLVDSLWSNLWPTLRRTFAFRLSFGPNDLVEHPIPTLVCTPESLQGRWTKHRIINPDDQIAACESSRVLCGQRDVRPILALAKNLGLEIHTLKELSRLERLHGLLSGSESFDDLLASIRLIDGLSNNRQIGADIKGTLIGRLTALIPGISCKQLLVMRNLSLSSFADTRPLWTAVEHLVSYLKFAREDDSDLIEIVSASADEDIALLPWRNALTTGLSIAARRDESAFYTAVWRWAEISQTAFASIVKTIPADAEIEQRLANNVPRKLHIANPATFLSPVLKKGWLTAHGAILAATAPPLEATYAQLKVDKDPNHSAGLRSALQYASLPEVLECTLTYKDPRLVEWCSDLAAMHPQILSNIRGNDITEQKVWGAAISKNVAVWSAPADAMGVRDTVMTQLADGLPTDTGLLKELINTPLADLSTTPERTRLWSVLPTFLRGQYLQATATGWLNIAARGSYMALAETELEPAILSSAGLKSLFERSPVTVDVLLSIVNALPSFSEDVFIAWLSCLLRDSPALSHAHSEQLGTLVASRHWEQAARYLSDRLANHRHDLMPGLRLCSDLLNFYTCWLRGISKPTSAEKWTALEMEACELYPSGPDSAELWSRAGGRNFDLSGLSQSGATRWHSALNSIRFGGRPTPRELIAVMCQDYPSNEKLRLYANDRDIVGWR